MKIERKEIAFLIATLLVAITANSWWRVHETGRRAKIAAQREAELREAGADADTPD